MAGGLSAGGAASCRADSFSLACTGSPNDDFWFLESKRELLLRLRVSPVPTPLAKDEDEDLADEMVEVRRNNGLNRALRSAMMSGAIAYLDGMKAKWRLENQNHDLIWISREDLTCHYMAVTAVSMRPFGCMKWRGGRRGVHTSWVRSICHRLITTHDGFLLCHIDQGTLLLCYLVTGVEYSGVNLDCLHGAWSSSSDRGKRGERGDKILAMKL